MSKGFNLDWLTELINNLPEISQQRKNLFSIAGFPRWENVISNLLAFYFDKGEEHKFSNLYIDSLFDVIEDNENGGDFNRNLFAGDYSVDREFTTESGKRIDIVLQNDKDWAIIIENKIYADLYNDLEDYWKSVNAKNKIGIVLSVQPVEASKKHPKFINILHQDLVNMVKQNLPNCYMEADDRHLMLLKEYILNIESMNNTKNQMEMESILNLFQNNHENIDRLVGAEKELSTYVAQSVRNVMGEYGFQQVGKDTSVDVYFHICRESMGKCEEFDIETLERFRITVRYAHLRKHNSFLSWFEFFDKDNAKYGKQLNERLRAKQIYTSNVTEGKKINQSIFQTYVLDIQLTSDDSCFEERLKKALDVNFFEKEFLKAAVSELKAIIEEEKNTRS